MLTKLETLPERLLELEASQLHEVLSGPTVIHLSGRRPEPLFVSVLLHGNEDAGWRAIRKLLRDYQNRELPRALSIFIGNVEAARYGQRFLDNQPDYNRIWRQGEGKIQGPESDLARQVVEDAKARAPFAVLDIHNNSGIQPHYACVNRLENTFLHLATLFSRTVVYFTKPDTVLSRAFGEFCPAVTAECGQPGQEAGTDHAFEYINACLHLSELPTHPVVEHDIDLFHTVAIAKIPEDVSFSFGDEDADIRFLDDIDRMNFRELPENTTLGWIQSGRGNVRLDVRDEAGKEVTDRYFKFSNGELRTKTPFMPSMLTVKTKAIKQDCFCYLMERYPDTF